MKARDQFMRIFVGALVSSSLSRKEIESGLREIASSPSFTFELRATVLDALDRLERRYLPIESQEAVSLGMEYGDLLLRAIEVRRLSKEQVIRAMRAVNPRFPVTGKGKLGTRSLIAAFTRSSSANEQQQLLNLLASESDEDSYLRGILNKR